MERFVQKIKDRTECFDDHFPFRKNVCNRLHMHNWLKLCILYIHTDMVKTRFMEFLMEDES
jgi:putative transposase